MADDSGRPHRAGEGDGDYEEGLVNRRRSRQRPTCSCRSQYQPAAR
jgi:hypothetical protein